MARVERSETRDGLCAARPLLGFAPLNSGYKLSELSTSIGFDPGGLDDRPPFFDLGLLISAQRLRRLLRRRRNFLALIGEALSHSGVGQRRACRRIELCHDLVRRPFRQPQPMPERSIKALAHPPPPSSERRMRPTSVFSPSWHRP